MSAGKIRSIKSFRVLLVEDHRYNQLVLQKMIETLGVPVVTASSGMEAIEIILENSDISVVLLDLKMPVMDGYETMRELRKINPRLVIIAETAYALAGDRKKIIEAGFDDYLPKPISLEKLKEILYKYLPAL